MKIPEVTPDPDSPSPLPSPLGRGKRGRGDRVRGIFKAAKNLQLFVFKKINADAWLRSA
jgi:hypothetical protein